MTLTTTKQTRSWARCWARHQAGYWYTNTNPEDHDPISPEIVDRGRRKLCTNQEWRYQQRFNHDIDNPSSSWSYSAQFALGRHPFKPRSNKCPLPLNLVKPRSDKHLLPLEWKHQKPINMVYQCQSRGKRYPPHLWWKQQVEIGSILHKNHELPDRFHHDPDVGQCSYQQARKGSGPSSLPTIPAASWQDFF